MFTTVRKVGFAHLQEAGHSLSFAVVEHVERLLIDEGPTRMEVSRLVAGWRPELFQLGLSAAEALVDARRDDETRALYEIKGYSVELQPEGIAFATDRFPALKLEAGSRDRLANVLTQMLRALNTHSKGKDYEVIAGRVVVLSPAGEPQATRRFSDGLHQALETKEGVEIQPERETLATMTFRELFRHFERLSGLAESTCAEGGR